MFCIHVKKVIPWSMQPGKVNANHVILLIKNRFIVQYEAASYMYVCPQHQRAHKPVNGTFEYLIFHKEVSH